MIIWNKLSHLPKLRTVVLVLVRSNYKDIKWDIKTAWFDKCGDALCTHKNCFSSDSWENGVFITACGCDAFCDGCPKSGMCIPWEDIGGWVLPEDLTRMS